MNHFDSIALAVASGMATAITSRPSLLEEFQSLLQLIRDDRTLTCHGRNKTNERCGNQVGKDAKKRLSVLCSGIAKCLKNGCDGIEALLRDASYLTMCLRRHQLQATDKYETWLAMIPSKPNDPSLDEAKRKVSIFWLKGVIAYSLLVGTVHFSHFIISGSTTFRRYRKCYGP